MRSKSRYVELMHKKSRVSLISRDELANGFVFCCCHSMEFECVALLVGTFVVVYSRRLPVPGTRYQVLYQVPGTGSSFLVYNTTMVDMIAKLNNKIIGRSSREQQKEKNVKREKRRKEEKKKKERKKIRGGER